MILLLSGKMGSGKTTLADAVAKAWQGYKTHRSYQINFADPLYEIHDFIRGYCRARGIERPDKDRPLLQLIGTEWGRTHVSENIWVDLTKTRIAREEEPSRSLDQRKLFIVGDCRFPNEITSFPDAVKVRLECDRAVRKYRCTKWTDSDHHLSETSLDGFKGFDFTFDTAMVSVDHCLNTVMAELLSRVSVEKL